MCFLLLVKALGPDPDRDSLEMQDPDPINESVSATLALNVFS